MMNDYTLPLLSLIIGALLGFLSTTVTSIIRQRQDIISRLLEEYFNVRKEVVGIVSEISSLDLRENLDFDRRNKYRDLIINLYYKHYDFLPKPALDALTLLYTCLDYPDKGPFNVIKNAVVPMKESDLCSFIEACSVFENTKYLAPLALKSKDPNVRANQVIILHARYVLFTINKFATMKDLLSMTKKMKKS